MKMITENVKGTAYIEDKRTCDVIGRNFVIP